MYTIVAHPGTPSELPLISAADWPELLHRVRWAQRWFPTVPLHVRLTNDAHPVK